MKPKPDPNELIRAVLDEIASPDFRADTLDKTLAYARRHRRFRKTVGLTACALVPLLILAGFLLLRSNPETQLAEHQPIPPPPDKPARGLITNGTKSVVKRHFRCVGWDK